MTINVGDRVQMKDGDRRFVVLVGVIKDIRADDWLLDDMVAEVEFTRDGKTRIFEFTLDYLAKHGEVVDVNATRKSDKIWARVEAALINPKSVGRNTV